VTPIIAGVVSWLRTKFPASGGGFRAPNDELRVTVGQDQYQIYFITNSQEAFVAASNINHQPLHGPATSRRGVIIADSAATANDPHVRSAIESNFSADAVYLGYLELQEVKKWPPSAP
jgi:hypothetical protein